MGRLRRVLPSHHITGDLRSASAMAPERYYTQVANGDILPCHAELSAFTPDGVRLADGTVIPCDLVLLCVGSETPRFPFVPDEYRKLLECEHDGVQLYRHLVHPDIPRVAFAGYNHGFMHVPTVEVGMHWLAALLRGELMLPDKQEMRDSIERVRSWKRQHINFEASRSCAVNTRFQQYLDSLLMDMNISPYRKLPNVLAELFGEYGAKDYAGILQACERSRQRGSYPRKVLPLDA